MRNNVIEIWQPKYMTDTCLIAAYKVKEDNIIKFTKVKHLEGMKFKISGDDIRSCEIVSNGKIDCYNVPMSMLKRVD